MARTLHERLPNTLEIPIPIPDPRPRGIRSLGALSISFSVRIDSLVAERIDRQARQLGIKRGEYMRWCTERMVDAIDRYIEDNPDSEQSNAGKQLELELVYPDEEHTPPTPDSRRE